MSSKKKMKHICRNGIVMFFVMILTILLQHHVMAYAEEKTVEPKKPTVKEEDGVYQIETLEHLYWFAGLVNGDESVCKDGVTQNTAANAVLLNDIVINAGVLNSDGTLASGEFEKWKPIASTRLNGDNNELVGYSGTFDGQGYTISGLYINDISEDTTKEAQYGLFGKVTGTVKRVGIIDSYIYVKRANTNLGGIAGYLGDETQETTMTIEYCYFKGVIAGGTNAGEVFVVK